MSKLVLKSLAVTLLITGSISAIAANPPGTTPPASNNNSGTMTIDVPVVMLVPMQFREDPNLAKGCWVRLYNDENLKGNDELTVVGPMQLKSLKMPGGVNWKHKAESLIVGPKARVTIYESELFKKKEAAFQPGQQVPNLRKGFGFLNSMESIKVECNP